MIRVFIGYDPREAIAYSVLCHSILEHSSEPVSIAPLALNSLPMFTRPRDERQSTDFSCSRFLVPFLCGFKGYAIFMDCDMLCLSDIAELWQLRGGNAVNVVTHDYTPSTKTKFLGHQQTIYPMKNWSSLMVFDCERCKVLDPLTVNEASGMFLHQFKWTDSVGSLPAGWNHLVGEQQPKVQPKIVHYTLGGPWFPGYENCEYSLEWYAAKRRMENPLDY